MEGDRTAKGRGEVRGREDQEMVRGRKGEREECLETEKGRGREMKERREEWLGAKKGRKGERKGK